MPESGCSDKFLFIHQEEWQRKLLRRYGSQLVLMDATYKTTKYSLHLFFVCVHTNVGYQVIAEFICETEDADSIAEALEAQLFREQQVLNIVNTNNGVEAQNKIFKYSYLPRSVDKTVYGIAVVLVESYLPESYQNYCDQNLRQSSQYRRFTNVPEYLHDRPVHFIKHCLKRFAAREFQVKASKDANWLYTVNLQTPCCSSEAWARSYFPYKKRLKITSHEYHKVLRKPLPLRRRRKLKKKAEVTALENADADFDDNKLVDEDQAVDLVIDLQGESSNKSSSEEFTKLPPNSSENVGAQKADPQTRVRYAVQQLSSVRDTLLDYGIFKVTAQDLFVFFPPKDVSKSDINCLQKQGDRFVPGWLTDSIIDSFLASISKKNRDVLIAETSLCAIVKSGFSTRSHGNLVDLKSGWKTSEWPCIQPKHARQTDGFNCGVFICLFARCLTEDINHEASFSPNTERYRLLSLLFGSCHDDIHSSEHSLSTDIPSIIISHGVMEYDPPSICVLLIFNCSTLTKKRN
ncbi:predicted protein [Nematostella vectensis]|uniref:ZSWIM1/3 RNaseH-like domain-containing protein n=1 Tax=Nematostella vectensis TaxID=45351 RepID=A7SNH3_NEMVE|nr:predicted protein [Nematostella vectensis]|eukprot:XP_001626832.1 predicted protein [Nematostella vectensis]